VKRIDQSASNPATAPAPPAGPDRRLLQAFGRRLAHVREERGLSQKALGDRLGTGDDVISKYERGLNVPKLATLLALRSALSVSLDYLLAGVATGGLTDSRLLKWAREANQLPAEQRDFAVSALETVVQTFRNAAEHGPPVGAGK
jgi:transcriptional regulator with XRE-family HTH domain